MSKKMRGNILLLITAIIWGCAFVAQRAGMEYIGPLTFNGIRSLIGGCVLLPVIFIKKKIQSRQQNDMKIMQKSPSIKYTFICGLVCGICLFAGTTLQQMGMVYTTAGKAGFITALYIVLVPIVGVFIGKKIRPILWCGVGLAIVGLYLLCVKEDFSINKGDLLILLCAFAFTIHIMFVDRVSQKMDGVVISCIQFFVCGFISLIGIFLFERIDWKQITDCAIPLLYAGVLSCGVAYTLQIIGQKYTEPTVASLLMSLESVFALLSGMLILKEKIQLQEVIGCLVMFVAIIFAQLPERKQNTNNTKNMKEV